MAFAPACSIPKTPSRGVRFQPCRSDVPPGVSPRRCTGRPCVQAASWHGFKRKGPEFPPAPCVGYARRLGRDQQHHGEQRQVKADEGGEVHALHLSASASIPASIHAAISRSFSCHAFTASFRP
jgi:hypothetical protein